jgi:site-specific DNA recombinase
MTQRAAIYLRVSTKKQAERDLSIPDQRRQIETFCEAQGLKIVAEYSDLGVSARSDRRPEFQKMWAAAGAKQRPFEVVVVYNWSRFFRDAAQSITYQRELEKRGVNVRAVTQDIGNDASGKLLRTILAGTDEHTSAMIADRTLGGMEENIRQGFVNGTPPYGYRSVVVEQRADKAKKRFEPCPKEADIVRLIFKLYVHGDGETGPLGIKSIVEYLNGRGYRQRRSKAFNINYVHLMLRNAAYVGDYCWNKTDSRTRQPKPESEWIKLTIPAVISPEVFDTVQQRLRRNNPKVTPPRTVNTPILLSGLIKCGHCGGHMTRGAGKNPKYRYYICSNKLRKGATACKGQWLPMAAIDEAVTEGLIGRVLQAPHLTGLVRGLQKRTSQSRGENAQARVALQRDLRRVQGEIDNLINAVAAGFLVRDDSVRGQIDRRKTEGEEIKRRMAALEREGAIPLTGLTNQKIDRFAQALAQILRTGDVALRRAYMQLFIDDIEAKDGELRLTGSEDALAAAVASGQKLAEGSVHAFVQKWRAKQDASANTWTGQGNFAT